MQKGFCAFGEAMSAWLATTIDGRQVFIGSCANGAFTYHLRYGEDVIVSLTSVGEGRFGEQVVQNLGE